jgi:very-short-patch-repair endonuclease
MDKKMHRGALRALCQMARENRNNETHAERVLWGYLKTKPLGFKFRRQHPYSIYILDFYCLFLKIAIESDGPFHHSEEIRISDEERQNFFENEGMDVLRFSNEEVLRDQEHVIESIEDYLRSKKQLNERQA